MGDMTTTSAPFREADVLRDTAGKFSGKSQSAPELTLDADDIDLRDFMQEPPTVAEPFTAFQPVVYTDVHGTDIPATVVAFEGNGYVRIAERTPGTIGDYDDEYRIVEERYLREDLDVSRDDVQRQQRALNAATELATDIVTKPKDALAGLDSYGDALHVRDQLKVDGRTDWHASHTSSVNAVDVAIEDIEHEQLMSPTVLGWAALDGSDGTPDAFRKADDAVSWQASTQLGAALKAKIVEQYADNLSIGDGHVERVTASLVDALALGTRMSAAVLAADEVEADADTIGDAAETVFPAHIEGLSQRKKAAYRKAVGATSEAFDTLERYGLLDTKHRPFSRWGDRPTTEQDILTRAAAQAAILRHYQPETGLTDAQLDAVSAVWDGAVAAYAKAAA